MRSWKVHSVLSLLTHWSHKNTLAYNFFLRNHTVGQMKPGALHRVRSGAVSARSNRWWPWYKIRTSPLITAVITGTLLLRYKYVFFFFFFFWKQIMASKIFGRLLPFDQISYVSSSKQEIMCVFNPDITTARWIIFLIQYASFPEAFIMLTLGRDSYDLIWSRLSGVWI